MLQSDNVQNTPLVLYQSFAPDFMNDANDSYRGCQPPSVARVALLSVRLLLLGPASGCVNVTEPWNTPLLVHASTMSCSIQHHRSQAQPAIV